MLRHSRAERREQDYLDADRRKGALQPASSRLLHLVSGGPFKSPIDITELFLFSLRPHCEPAKREELDRQRHKGILLLLTLKIFWTVPHLLAAVNHSVVTTSFTSI